MVRASLFDKMRDAIKDDIEKLLANAPEGRPQAQRFTRKEQIRQQQAVASAEDAEEGAAAGPAAAAAEPEHEVRVVMSHTQNHLQRISQHGTSSTQPACTWGTWCWWMPITSTCCHRGCRSTRRGRNDGEAAKGHQHAACKAVSHSIMSLLQAQGDHHMRWPSHASGCLLEGPCCA